MLIMPNVINMYVPLPRRVESSVELARSQATRSRSSMCQLSELDPDVRRHMAKTANRAVYNR